MKEAIAHLSKTDKKLKYIFETFGEPIVQKRDQGFASMCAIILEQQVSIASAQACYQKLNCCLIEINAISVLNATETDLKNCGISRQKITYLKDLAQKVENNRIDFSTFKNKTETQIRAELITVKGIGNWSIDVYLMFCLQRNDIIPLGDIAVKNIMTELYQTQTEAQMKEISDLWSPHRTYATCIIWHYYLKKRNRL